MGSEHSLAGTVLPGDLLAPAVVSPVRSWARRGYQRALARAARLDGDDLRRAAVVFAPHPDDETLGCGGTILRKRAAGAAVTVVFMTDGSGSHRRFLAGDAMKAIRSSEALAAAAVLGVADRDVVFFNFPNRGLWDHRASAISRVLEVLRQRQPEQVFLAYRHDAHPDHEATFVCVAEAARSWGGRPALYEYPIWFWRHWPWTPGSRGLRAAGWLARSALAGARLLHEFTCAVDISDVLERKQIALAQ
ncbi:MAG: PIG-L deacetylase family protein, partial [Armatimonadota bacterium]